VQSTQKEMENQENSAKIEFLTGHLRMNRAGTQSRIIQYSHPGIGREDIVQKIAEISPKSCAPETPHSHTYGTDSLV
jgi:hypothetical protein